MSETSTLIPCSGKITRAELAKLPTPPATETHIPIPHAAVVETLVETLSHRHIGVVGEEFAVSKDEMEMFGVLDLETMSVPTRANPREPGHRDPVHPVRPATLHQASASSLL